MDDAMGSAGDVEAPTAGGGEPAAAIEASAAGDDGTAPTNVASRVRPEWGAPADADPGVGAPPTERVAAGAPAWTPEIASPPRPAPAGRSLRTQALLIFAFVAVGVVAALAVRAIASGTSPTDQAIAAAGQRLLDEPAFRDRFHDLDGASAFDAGAQLAKQGVRRLDDAQLLTLYRGLDALLARAPDHTCAVAFGGTKVPDDAKAIRDALTALDPDTLRSYLDVSVAAALAELRDDPPVQPAPGEAQAATIVAGMLRSLPSGDLARLTPILTSLSTASDGDVCWAGRTIVGQALALPDGDRALVLRSFVANG